MDQYVARLLMLSFFLPMKLQVLATMGTCVYFVVRSVVAKQAGPAGNYLHALILGSGFLLFLFAIPFTTPEFMKPLLENCQHRVSFLFMPFVFAIVSPKFKEVLMGELMYFVYGCFIICVAANADIGYHYYYAGSGVQPLSHVGYRSTVHAFTEVHPTYLSMYLCFSICILLLSQELDIRVRPYIQNVLLYGSFIFLLALGAKMPIIALVIILVHFAWVRRADLRRHRSLLIGLPLSVAAAWIFIPFLRQRLYEMLQFFGSGRSGSIADNSVYARQMIWSMDMSLLKNYWLTGVGPGRVFSAMRLQSFFYSLGSGIPAQYHDPHNEYFYEWLCFGILGIAIFVATLFTHFRQAVRFKDHLYLYLLLVLCITFFTETVLSLQRGVMFYAVFTSLMYYRPGIKRHTI